MDCQEYMISIIKRQTEGVVYHENMTDYYRFLCLDSLKEIHCHQSQEELETLQCTKDCYAKIYFSIPQFEMENTTLIPAEWYSKTSMDVTKGAIKSLSKESLYHWLDWEKETLSIYKEAAMHFKENMAFYQLKIAKKLIKCVSAEICEIEGLITEGLAYDFSPEFLKYYYKIDE